MPQLKPRPDRFQVQQCMSIKFIVLSVITMILAPTFLIYLTMRCEKNQCILFQLPLVVPTHLSAYFSPLSFAIVIGFIILMFLLSSATTSHKVQDTPSLSTGMLALLCSSISLFVLAYLKSEYINVVHGEYLRMLVTTTVICIGISLTLFLLNYFDMIPGGNPDLCSVMSFFYGSNISLNLGHVELKYFFYVHVGLVAWALLDQLIVLHVIVERHITAPVAFLLVTQFLYIGHMLLYEKFIKAAPFVFCEGLGFFWLIRVMMYLPFFHSLPLYYAATTEVVLSKPFILADCVLFLFGFVIYISALHQRESFIADPRNFKKMKSIVSPNGSKRLLVSGYWGIVQKPDYLGYVIMWLSWTVICGFSGLSIILLLVMLATVYMWLRQSSRFKQHIFGGAWTKYTAQVPKQIIPHVF